VKRPVLKVKPRDKSYESYLVRQDGKTMVFREPPAARRMSILLSVAVTVQLIVGPLIGAFLTGKPFYAVLSVVGAAWVLWFLYRIAGPNDIRLDGEQRTYDRTTGWPWKPVRAIGSFADIRGVCISPGRRVMLLMVKRKSLRRGVVVSNPAISATGSSALFVDNISVTAATHKLMEELNQKYGFPIVPYQKT
jgi:hypothetical protein